MTMIFISSQELMQMVRSANRTQTVPPPWVPFGSSQANQVDTSKKVLEQTIKQETESSSEFSQARQAALAEALEAKLKITKTFTQTVCSIFLLEPKYRNSDHIPICRRLKILPMRKMQPRISHITPILVSTTATA